jgi:hypothetical protein
MPLLVTYLSGDTALYELHQVSGLETVWIVDLPQGDWTVRVDPDDWLLDKARHDVLVPVHLLALTATREESGVAVAWTIADPVDHLGFRLHRQRPGSPRVAWGPPLLSGRRDYRLLDQDAPKGPVDYWLEEISRTGSSRWHGPVSPKEGRQPAGPVLTVVEPHPVAGSATIRFTLAAPGPVALSLYDLQGRRRHLILDETLAAGEHRLTWAGTGDDGARLPTGIYFLQLRTEAGVEGRKVVLTP